MGWGARRLAAAAAGGCNDDDDDDDHWKARGTGNRSYRNLVSGRAVWCFWQ